MNQNDNDILRRKDSRFSDEDRARIAQENSQARLNARRKREEKAAELKRNSEQVSEKNEKQKKINKAGNNKNTTVHKNRANEKKRSSKDEMPGSRNDRIKDSQQERKKTHKRNNNLIISMVFIVAIAVIGIFAAFALKVNVIEVSGSERYSDTSVLSAAGLDTSDSMLLLNAKSMENKIETLLPFIETAQIKRVWPDKITVFLTDAVPTLAVDSGEGYILMNNSLKVLDDDAVTVGSDTALLKGVKISSAVPGKTVELTDKISTEAFSSLADAFTESGITGITEYDLSVISDVSVIIDHRIEVKFGTLAGAAEKFSFGKEVIDKTVASDSRHSMIVDLTAEGKAYVRDKNDSNVVFDVIPEETTLSAEETSESEQITEQQETSASDEGYISVG